MSNAMSLKAKIRNISKQKNIPAQVILQNYMFERLLVRLSCSEFKDKFVLKGGMLVAAIVGLDNRATMDLDTTLKNLPLTPDAIYGALEQICAIPVDDGVSFALENTRILRAGSASTRQSSAFSCRRRFSDCRGGRRTAESRSLRFISTTAAPAPEPLRILLQMPGRITILTDAGILNMPVTCCRCGATTAMRFRLS